MSTKKWIIGIGLSAQVVIVVMMVLLLKELREEPEEYDPYLDISVKEETVQQEKPPVPFSRYVQGKGTVIPSSGYVKIHAATAGTIEDVYVTAGQKVQAGDLLFKVDDSLLRCHLNEKQSEVRTAVVQLERILVEYEKRLGEALVEEKLANCKTIEKQLDDCNVKAPIDGRVLAVHIHPGEYCDAAHTTAMFIGAEDPLHLRVLVEKSEAWKVNPSPHMRAIAVHRSNPQMQFLLEYVSVSPCFTDDNCLELTFAFDRQKNPVYLDEILDVYIEASDAALLDYQFSRIRG